MENELTIKTLLYIPPIWYYIAYITIAIAMHSCHIRDFARIQMYPNHFFLYLCILHFPELRRHTFMRALTAS